MRDYLGQCQCLPLDNQDLWVTIFKKHPKPITPPSLLTMSSPFITKGHCKQRPPCSLKGNIFNSLWHFTSCTGFLGFDLCLNHITNLLEWCNGQIDIKAHCFWNKSFFPHIIMSSFFFEFSVKEHRTNFHFFQWKFVNVILRCRLKENIQSLALASK